MADAWTIKKVLDENGKLDGFRQNLEQLPEGKRSFRQLLEAYAPGQATVSLRVKQGDETIGKTETDPAVRQRAKDALRHCENALKLTDNGASPGEAWLDALDRAVVLRALENYLIPLSGMPPGSTPVPYDALAARLRASRLLQVQQVATHFSPENKEWITRLGYSVTKPAPIQAFQLQLTSSTRKIAAGASVQISWSSQNCTELVLDGSPVSASGTQSFVLHERREFVLRGRDPQGSLQVRRVITDVAVTAPARPRPPPPPPLPPPLPPQILEMSIAPQRARAGDTVAIAWRVVNASSIVLQCQALGLSERIAVSRSDGGTTLILPRKLPRGRYTISLHCSAAQQARELTVRSRHRPVALVLQSMLLLLLCWFIAAVLQQALRPKQPTPQLSSSLAGLWQGTVTESNGSRTPLVVTLRPGDFSTVVLGRKACEERMKLEVSSRTQTTFTPALPGARCRLGNSLLNSLVTAPHVGAVPALDVLLLGADYSTARGTLTRQPQLDRPQYVRSRIAAPASPWRASRDRCMATGRDAQVCDQLIAQCQENDVRPEFCVPGP